MGPHDEVGKKWVLHELYLFEMYVFAFGDLIEVSVTIYIGYHSIGINQRSGLVFFQILDELGERIYVFIRFQRAQTQTW